MTLEVENPTEDHPCKRFFDKEYCDTFCKGAGCKEKEMCEEYKKNV